MAGTSEGARKAAQTRLKKYGKDALSVWGKKGSLIRAVSDNRHIPFKRKEYASEMGLKGAEARWGKEEKSEKTQQKAVDSE